VDRLEAYPTRELSSCDEVDSRRNIVSYASRAFARFYALQCLVAFWVTWHDPTIARRRSRLIWFGVLSVICLAVFAFGVPAE